MSLLEVLFTQLSQSLAAFWTEYVQFLYRCPKADNKKPQELQSLCSPQKRWLFAGTLNCVYCRKGHLTVWSISKRKKMLKIYLCKEHCAQFELSCTTQKQKTSSLSKQHVPCTRQAVAFPRDRCFHGMSVFPQSRPRAVGSVPQVCSICFPVFPSPST